jgi:hypothetical protein
MAAMMGRVSDKWVDEMRLKDSQVLLLYFREIVSMV